MSTDDDPNLTARKRPKRLGRAKLTEDQVRIIRASDGLAKVVAHQFGVNDQTIRRIRKRQRWGHIE